MRIAILSRSQQLYSTRSLLRACKKRGHDGFVLDLLQCRLNAKPGEPTLYLGNKALSIPDGIIARIGSSLTERGAAILRHFELFDIPLSVRAEALLASRDKFTCLQLAEKARIKYPTTIFSTDPAAIKNIIRELGLPLVLKLTKGTHGMGVHLLTTEMAVHSSLEMLLRLQEPFVLQKYITEASGVDLRAIVVNNQVVAAMKRKALPGDFRSNLHRGGTGMPVRLTPREEEMALEAAKMTGLQVAGVDMLPTREGPLLLEVNASPGLEGIETVTGVDVAGKIVEWLENAS